MKNFPVALKLFLPKTLAQLLGFLVLQYFLLAFRISNWYNINGSWWLFALFVLQVVSRSFLDSNFSPTINPSNYARVFGVLMSKMPSSLFSYTHEAHLLSLCWGLIDVW
jgi:hypothetical protein